MHKEVVQNNIKSEKINNCPWCNSVNIKFFTESYDLLLGLSDQKFTYAKCADCETVFQSVRPIQNEIGQFYSPEYKPHKRTKDQKSQHVIEKINNKLNAMYTLARSNFLKKTYIRSANSAKFLDFGCGGGTYVEKMKSLGWDATGVDFSPELIEDLRRRGLNAIAVDSKEWNELPQGTFELIRLNHVLEHLYDPEELLTKFYKLLAPGGHIHIALPNSQSLFLKIFKNNWFALDAPRHIMLVSSTGLIDKMTKIGFSKIDTFHDLDPKDILRSFGYTFSKLFKYDRSQIINWPIKYPMANLLFYPFSALTAKMGKSDRYEIVAQK